MKKLFALLSVLVMASMLLTACGSPAPVATAAPVVSEAPVVTEAPTATEAPAPVGDPQRRPMAAQKLMSPLGLIHQPMLSKKWQQILQPKPE
jgi:hypothetical protein